MLFVIENCFGLIWNYWYSFETDRGFILRNKVWFKSHIVMRDYELIGIAFKIELRTIIRQLKTS
jgi:hypothetical protein